MRLLKEPTTDGQHYANFAHELDPEMPGLVVVVHHGVTGIGKVSPRVSFSGAKPRPRMNEDAAVAQRLTVGRGEGARRFWRLL